VVARLSGSSSESRNSLRAFRVKVRVSTRVSARVQVMVKVRVSVCDLL
jgi:hypothetical protein